MGTSIPEERAANLVKDWAALDSFCMQVPTVDITVPFLFGLYLESEVPVLDLVDIPSFAEGYGSLCSK